MTSFALSVAGAMLIQAGVASAQSTGSASPPPPPCEAAEFHQFDFWVGKWDVYGPNGKQVANSLIEKVYGCGIRENWMPFSKNDGGSLSIYVPGSKQWEQFWVDSGGSRVHFTGGWDGKAMVLTGRWGGPLTRMTYTKADDGSVRQYGEQSTDDGKTWTAAFDFTYRPHKDS